ncbi:AAA ATPase [Marasmius crinis-equi]|uniref:AAA ATPase n=1 Tax=Marasmius crinis-equi TaxID=585013 RepID=A0ABR3FAM2_9AGAR
MSAPRTPRLTRSSSSVLGKRSYQRDCSSSSCEQLQTPETPNSKRIKISTTALNGDANKENIAPYDSSSLSGGMSPVTPRMTRSLRRSATDTVMVTPTRPRISSTRRASVTSELSPTTPATAISHLSLATPPPTPPALLPIQARVRALLRPTCNDIHELPGRESERATITDFISSFLGDCDTNYPCNLFVSGTPGTGKTALISSVMQSIDYEAHAARVLIINCMALNGMDALWTRLLEELRSPQKGRAKKLIGREGLESVLKGLKTKCILVLDELDHIASTPQALSQLFTLTASYGQTLRVIGIANTHTLTSSSVASSSDVQTLHFAPYTSTQLLQILQSRLSPLQSDKATAEEADAFKKFMPTPTITLLSKKVASLTGDVRALFEVLRGAIDIAVKPKAGEDVLAPSSHIVTPSHVLSALKAYKPTSPSTSTASSSPSAASSSPMNSNSEIVTKVRALSFQARLTLLSILLASKRVEAGLFLTSPSSSPVKRSNSSSSLGNTNNKDLSFDVGQLHAFYSLVLNREPDSSICSTVSRGEFGDLLGMLEGVGLISTSSLSSPTKPKRGFSRAGSFSAKAGSSSGAIKLNAGVWADEVLRGLGVGSGSSSEDIKEEEINALWVRESGRIAKEVKVIQAEARKEECGVGFSDAIED